MGNIFFRQLPSRIMFSTKVGVILLRGMKNLTPKKYSFVEKLKGGGVKGRSPSME